MTSAVLALAGVAALAAPAIAQPQSPPPAAAPAATPTWNLALPDKKDPAARARLSFGVSGTRDQPLYLSCAPGAGQVLAVFDVTQKLASRKRGDVWVDAIGRPSPWAVSVTVASLTQKTVLRGVAYPSETSEGSTVAVEVSTLAPVVDEWRKTQALRIEAVLQTNQQPPAPKAVVARFLKACG